MTFVTYGDVQDAVSMLVNPGDWVDENDRLSLVFRLPIDALWDDVIGQDRGYEDREWELEDA